jgi:putative YhbY family RNA-binding protein
MPAPASDSLPPKERRALRARAHALKPVVWIAQRGLTEGTLRELDRALNAHELIKIHAAVDERDERSRLLETLCRALHAQPVQVIGKMLVAYRPRPPEQTQPQAPQRIRPAPGQARAKRAPGGRRPSRTAPAPTSKDRRRRP